MTRTRTILRRAATWVRSEITSNRFDEEVNRRFGLMAARVRIAIGVLALAGSPLLAAQARTLVIPLLLLAYLPYAIALRWLVARRPGAGINTVAAVGDLLVVFTFSMAVPDTRVVALLGYLLLVGFHSLAGGVVVGLIVTVFAVPLALGAEFAGHPRMIDGFTLFMFVAVLVALTTIVSVATRERRAVTRFLSRLQRAIADVPDGPGLEATLAAVGRAAREAIEAKFVSVLVRDDDGLMQGSLEGDIGSDSKDRSREMIDRIMAAPERSPSGLALVSGEVVVVERVETDPRFRHWSDETQRQRFTSTIAVPLRAGDEVIGVIAGYLPQPSLVKRESVDLLRAYAEHATVVILRALAFEHERKASARLAEADRMKSELVATVSHELRTPLTSVKGFAETLVRSWERFDDPKRFELVERIVRNADTLAAMIEQVLDFSRLESGATRIVPEPIDLADALYAYLHEAQPLFDRHDLVADLPDELWVSADVAAVRHVISNLLSNAVKYSPEGAVVILRVATEGDEAVISVSDQGPGIPPADQGRIFERFYRGPGATQRGTGIGLAIARSYVELVGGDIWVESEEGKGSTFLFTLPLTSAPDRVPVPSGESGPSPGE